jgi:hypothetical protein
MIHPLARLLLLVSLLVVSATAERIIALVALATILAAYQAAIGFGRILTIFVLTTIVPLSIGLAIISATQPGVSASVFSYESFRPAFQALARVFVFGVALQIFFSPMIRSGTLVPSLRAMFIPSLAVALVAASVNAIEDIERFSRSVVDAIKARGLAKPWLVWRIRELPNIIVAVFSYALRSAFQRTETWQHREVTAEALALVDQEQWAVWKSLALAGVGIAVAIVAATTTVLR